MLWFCHACTYGSTYEVERGATSGGLYLTAQLQLAAFSSQPGHTCGIKLPLSNWLQPGHSALLTWGKNNHNLYPPYCKLCYKDARYCSRFSVLCCQRGTTHEKHTLYSSPCHDHLNFQYLLSHVLAAYPSLAVTAILKPHKSIPPLLPKNPFLLQQTHLSSYLSLDQRMHNFLYLYA
jgi:hypothetical protein